jgi:hypothetical protein
MARAIAPTILEPSFTAPASAREDTRRAEHSDTDAALQEAASRGDWSRAGPVQACPKM